MLENAGVRESLQRGFAMVLENWKNVGLMWLVMIGLGIVWAIASIILIIVTIPVVIVTAVIAILVAALPFLLLVGIFSTFLGGYLPVDRGWAVRSAFVLHPCLLALASIGQLADSVHIHSLDVDLSRDQSACPALRTASRVEPVGD